MSKHEHVGELTIDRAQGTEYCAECDPVLKQRNNEMTKREVIVLQGVPGSGKSTLALRLAAAHTGGRTVIVSADNYHIDPDYGGYLYKAENVGAAHAQCLRNFVTRGLSQDAVDLIIVDNTNTTVAEVAPYMALAAAYGFEARIIHVVSDWVEAAARNIHGVPLKTVAQLHFNLQTFAGPIWWLRNRYEEGVEVG